MPPIPRVPPAKTKTIGEYASDLLRVGKLTYKVLKAAKQIEFGVVTENPFTNRPQTKITHTVDLTDDEHRHLHTGGSLYVVHACGYQVHVRA